MSLLRWIRHGWLGLLGARRSFDREVCTAIEQAVAAAEGGQGGEIRFAVEAALDAEQLFRGVTPRQRALAAFSSLGVWDTEHNNGTLIYVLLADRSVEIVADRGVASRVSEAEWRAVCSAVEARYRAGEFRDGSVQAVEQVAALLARHFPGPGRGSNELPNQPALL